MYTFQLPEHSFFLLPPPSLFSLFGLVNTRFILSLLSVVEFLYYTITWPSQNSRLLKTSSLQAPLTICSHCSFGTGFQ